MLARVTMRRQSIAVGFVLAGAATCWVVASSRGMPMMGGVAPFLGAWATAMAAMMLPSATPMIAAYAGLARQRASTPAFVLGYLAVWTATGLVAYWLGLELPGWRWLVGAGLIVG